MRINNGGITFGKEGEEKFYLNEDKIAGELVYAACDTSILAEAGNDNVLISIDEDGKLVLDQLSSSGQVYTKDEVDGKLNSKVDKLEEHTINHIFNTRITASDETGSKYEIPNGSVAYPKRIGGMSYKSKNLLVLDDVEETTLNGITYSIKNGVTIINGTATTKFSITIPIKSLTLNGSYTFNAFNNYANATYDDSYVRLNNQVNSVPDSNHLYLNSINKTSTYTYSNQSWDSIYITLKQGITFSNAIISLMLVSGETAPTKFEAGFEGIRNSAVTEIKSIGANLFNPSETENIYVNICYVSLIDNGVRVGIEKSYSSTTNALSVFSKTSIPISKFKNGATYRIMANVSSMNNIDISGTRIVIRGVNYLGKYTYYQVIDNISSLSKTFTLNFDETIEFIEVNLYCGHDTNSVTEGQYIDYTNIYFGLADETRDYVPYWEETLHIPEQIQALDGYGLGINKEYHNYIDLIRKVFVKMVDKIDLGTLTWRYNSSYECFITDISNKAPNQLGICEIYENIGVSNVNLLVDKSYCSNETIYLQDVTFFVKDLQYGSDVTAFKNSLSGVKFVYALQEPIETDISEYLSEYSYKVDNLGTEIAVNEYGQAVPTTIDYNVSINEQVIENSDNIAKIKEKFDDYLPLSGGRIDGNLSVNDTLEASSANISTLIIGPDFKFGNGTYTAMLPAKNGTIAFTDDLKSFLSLRGGTVNGDIGVKNIHFISTDIGNNITDPEGRIVIRSVGDANVVGNRQKTLNLYGSRERLEYKYGDDYTEQIAYTSDLDSYLKITDIISAQQIQGGSINTSGNSPKSVALSPAINGFGAMPYIIQREQGTNIYPCIVYEIDGNVFSLTTDQAARLFEGSLTNILFFDPNSYGTNDVDYEYSETKTYKMGDFCWVETTKDNITKKRWYRCQVESSIDEDPVESTTNFEDISANNTYAGIDPKKCETLNVYLYMPGHAMVYENSIALYWRTEDQHPKYYSIYKGYQSEKVQGKSIYKHLTPAEWKTCPKITVVENKEITGGITNDYLGAFSSADEYAYNLCLSFSGFTYANNYWCAALAEIAISGSGGDLDKTVMFRTKSNEVYGNIKPGFNTSYSLGDNNYKWQNIYAHQGVFTTIKENGTALSSKYLAINSSSHSVAARVYGVKNDGTQSMWSVVSGATSWTIPYRLENGVINVGTPTANSHATTKKYVDDALSQYVHQRSLEEGYIVAGEATKATQDGDGNVITSTYATKTEVNTSLNDKANIEGDLREDEIIIAYDQGSVTGSGKQLSDYYTKKETDDALSQYADKQSLEEGRLPVIATKATQDGDGNVITNTYATKSEVNTSLNDKANIEGDLQEDEIIIAYDQGSVTGSGKQLSDYYTKTEVNNLIPKTYIHNIVITGSNLSIAANHTTDYPTSIANLSVLLNYLKMKNFTASYMFMSCSGKLDNVFIYGLYASKGQIVMLSVDGEQAITNASVVDNMWVIS